MFKKKIFSFLLLLSLCNVSFCMHLLSDLDIEYLQETAKKDEKQKICMSMRNGDFQYLVAGDQGGEIRVWNVATGGFIPLLDGQSGGHKIFVVSLDFSPDGRLLVSGSLDSTIRIWNFLSLKCLHVLDCNGGPVRSVAFSPDGTLVVSGGDDATVRVWSVQDGRCLHVIKTKSAVGSVCFINNEQILFGAGNYVKIFNWQNEECVFSYHHPCQVSCVAYHQEINQFTAVDFSGGISIWNLETKECLNSGSLRGSLYGLLYSKKGDLLLTCSDWDMHVKIWNSDPYGFLKELQVKEAISNTGRTRGPKVMSLNITDEMLAVSCAYSKKIRVLDVEREKLLTQLEHNHSVMALKFAPFPFGLKKEDVDEKERRGFILRRESQRAKGEKDPFVLNIGRQVSIPVDRSFLLL